MPRLGFPLFLVLLLSLTVSAEIRPIMPAQDGPAAFGQWIPDVATDGTSIVSVWMDDRMHERPNFTRGMAVMATALDSEGRALSPYGIVLAADRPDTPNVASNGSTFVVSYNTHLAGWFLRVDNDARPLGEPKQIAARPIMELASNGATYAALVYSDIAKSEVLILDENGVKISTIAIEGWTGSLVSVAGNYLAFTARPTCGAQDCPLDLVVTTIEPDGSHDERTFSEVPDACCVMKTVSGASRVLVAWASAGTATSAIDYTILNSSGGATSPVKRLHSGAISPYGDIAVPSVGWDGESFLVAWSDRAARISTVSKVLEEMELSWDAPFQTAFTGSRVVMTSSEEWSAAPDAVSRSVRSFRDLDDEDLEGQVITFSPTPQSEPDVDSAGSVAMAVTREGESYGAIAGSVFAPEHPGDEKRVTIAHKQEHLFQDGPSVAAGGDFFLVVWREVTWGRSMRILARRVAANGSVLDGAPIVVFRQEDDYNNFADTDIAFDGETFLVVWHSADQEIRAQRVRRDGVLEGGPILVSRHPAAERRERRTPVVAWTGQLFVVIWSEAPPPRKVGEPPMPLLDVYRSARITRDGTLLDAGESATLFTIDGYSQGTALARGGGQLMFVSTTGSYLSNAEWSVQTFAFDATGLPLSSGPTRIDPATSFQRVHPAVAWNGSAFLAFWNERTDLGPSSVLGVRLTKTGALDGPIELDAGTGFAPTAASLRSGAVLVQTALRPEQGNVARLYAQTLPATFTRRRTARP